VIDEFRTRSFELINDEYVVLANYGNISVDLNEYCLYKKAPGTIKNPSKPELLYRFDKYTLLPGQKVILGGTDYSGTGYLDYNGTASLADSNNVIILYNNYYDKGGIIVDSVTYGSVIFSDVEGSPLGILSKGVAYKRTNIPEVNDNSLDFSPFFPTLPTDLNADKLVISELLPSPATGEEWFELYNPTNLDVSMANLKICDAPTASRSRRCYPFAKDEKLTGNSYKIFPQSLTKITLNNTGDWLELYDTADNLLTDSGGDYGAADKGISLSLFGSEYRWTKALTPAATNVFTDTIELEVDTVPTAKTTSKSKVVTATKKTIAATTLPAPGQIQDAEADVKAANTTSAPVTASTIVAVVGRKQLGWGLIGLAILLVLGYICWYFRDYAKEIYDKIRHRDDSARF